MKIKKILIDFLKNRFKHFMHWAKTIENFPKISPPYLWIGKFDGKEFELLKNTHYVSLKMVLVTPKRWFKVVQCCISLDTKKIFTHFSL